LYCQINPPESLRSPRHTLEIQVLDIPVCLEASATETYFDRGGMTATLVDLKLLFAVVLKSASSCIILAHNHPSGNLKPSEADKMLHNNQESS